MRADLHSLTNDRYSSGVIVDAFLANNEVDLARFRMQYLSPEVKHFYIGEARITFSGKSKPLIFKELSEEIQVLGTKITCIEIEIPKDIKDSTDRWKVEEFIRDSFLHKVCEQLGSESSIIFSDLDEIPSLSQVKFIDSLPADYRLRSFKTPCYYRKANWKVLGDAENWAKGKIVNSKYPENLIRYKTAELIPGKSGVHLSYLNMNSEQMSEKYSSFSHSEYDRPEYSSYRLINFADKYGVNHSGQAFSKGSGLLQEVEEEDLDSVLKAAFSKHPNWFSFEPFLGNKLTRITASCMLTKFIRKPSSALSLDRVRWSSLYSVFTLAEILSFKSFSIVKVGAKRVFVSTLKTFGILPVAKVIRSWIR